MRSLSKGRQEAVGSELRVHAVYSRTACLASLADCAPRIFNNFRAFNMAAQFDFPRLHKYNGRVFNMLDEAVYIPRT